MKNNQDIKKVYTFIEEQMDTLERSYDFPNYFYQAFLSGENTLLQKEIAEVKVFDTSWIDVIERNLVSIDKIMKYPKSGLRYEQNVEAIEKAKKVNATSIRHLAANTHLIKEIRQNNVIPKKILTTQAEIEDAIYENRFVKTLIDRLFEFVNERYQTVKSHVAQAQFKQFELDSNFEIEQSKIRMKLELQVTEPSKTGNHEENVKIMQRIHSLLKMINGFKTSTFMEQLKNIKPVKAPILKTQILQKNVDYKNCYQLWVYLDQNTSLSFDLNVEEKNLSLDKKYLRHMYQQVLSTFVMIHGNQLDLEDQYQYLDKDQYTKKAPKVSKKRMILPDDALEAFSYQPSEINEFYHEKNKKAFKDKVKAFEAYAPNHHLALKKAVQETIHITNALFQDVFELNDEADSIFMQGIKTPIEDQIKTLEDKIKVLKMIRKAKESDYQETMRQEKSLIRDLNTHYQTKLKEEKKRIKDAAKAKAVEETIKLEKKHLKENQKALQAHMSIVSELKHQIKEEEKKYQRKYKEKMKEMKLQEKLLIEKEIDKSKDKYAEKIEKQSEKRAHEVAYFQHKKKQQKNVLEQSFNQRIKHLLETSEKHVTLPKDDSSHTDFFNPNKFDAT